MTELDRALVLHPVSAIVGAICLGVGLAGAAALVRPAFAQAPAARGPLYPAKILSCHDGDTCRADITVPSVWGVRQVLENQELRFCGIDTPELSTGAPGAAARDALRAWVAAAGRIEVEPYVKDGKARKDSLGRRWIVWVYADGVDLNARLLAEGLAVPEPGCVR